jgi:putative endonuclease
MPPREYHFWVYILSSRSRNLYIGITNDIHRLVYCEYFRYVRTAIAREKELKRWTRAQKVELIERTNPTWEDILPPIPL